MSDKTVLRRSLLAARMAISQDARIRWDAAIGAQVIAWWQANPVSSLGVYWPIRNEPDLRGLYVDLASRGVQLALPVVVAADAPLQFFAWTPGEAMEKDAMNVAIPVSRNTPVRPQALLIPCVGFNADLVRLGYGGGFYDRTLAATPRPLAIGIGYACGRACFDSEPHDVALDMVITEAPDAWCY